MKLAAVGVDSTPLPLPSGAGTPRFDSSTKPWSLTWMCVYVVPFDGNANPIGCIGYTVSVVPYPSETPKSPTKQDCAASGAASSADRASGRMPDRVAGSAA